MDIKYELLKDDTIKEGDHTCYRIRALRDIRYGVKKGDLGGYIEKESNLSHEGICWVSGNAWVSGDAQVYDNARVSGNAKVSGNACIQTGKWTSGNITFSIDNIIKAFFENPALAPTLIGTKAEDFAHYLISLPKET